MPTPELLAPAGDMSRLRTALRYGADAVYLGGSDLDLRARSGGFDRAGLIEAVDHAHAAGAGVYYTLNLLARDEHLPAVEARLEELAAMGEDTADGSTVDGLIIADPGVLRLARRIAPSIPVHLSTQANTGNAESVGFWRDLGISRVNLARETDADAMEAIARRFPDMELEVFTHGAMCLAVSGRCLLSQWLNRRPANLGQCTHPCRFEYRALGVVLEEKTRPGEPIWEARDEDGFGALYAMDDLCLVEYLDRLRAIPVAALKIEGRVKTEAYVAQVVDAYRAALDGLAAPAEALAELRNVSSRRLSTGFFLPGGQQTVADILPESERRPILAKITATASPGTCTLAIKSRWDASRDAALMLPGLRRPLLPAGSYTLENPDGQRLTEAHPGTNAVLHCDGSTVAELLDDGLFIKGV